MGVRLRCGFTDDERRRLLDRVEHDEGARTRDRLHAAKSFAKHAAEVLRVDGAHLDEIAVFASDVVDLEHLGCLGDRLRHAVGSVRIGRPHEHERQQAEADGGRIDQRGVTAHDAALLELADALEDRRRSQPDLPCELGVRRPAVFLKNRQYFRVRTVDHSEMMAANGRLFNRQSIGSNARSARTSGVRSRVTSSGCWSSSRSAWWSRRAIWTSDAPRASKLYI